MIEVIGLGAHGRLDESARRLLSAADVVVSSPRLFALLDDGFTAERRVWPSPLLKGLNTLFADRHDQRIVVLATGDPLQAGIATTLIRFFGANEVRTHPAVSSVALARARLGWSAEQTEVLNLLTSPVSALRRLLTPKRRILLLSPNVDTPALVANELVLAGWGDAVITVLADLDTESESVVSGVAEHWQLDSGSALNIVAVELPCRGPALGTSPGLPDTAFDHDGQLTKWEFRAIALASLRPLPGELLWDLGAGAGSVGIEWTLHHSQNQTICVERDPERVARIQANASKLGATNLSIKQGEVIQIINDLPDPDAIFIGGGISQELIAECFSRLRPQGRLVVHSVTIDSTSLLLAAQDRYGGQLRRINLERAEPLGHYLSWLPARAVTHWALIKEDTQL